MHGAATSGERGGADLVLAEVEADEDRPGRVAQGFIQRLPVLVGYPAQ